MFLWNWRSWTNIYLFRRLQIYQPFSVLESSQYIQIHCESNKISCKLYIRAIHRPRKPYLHPARESIDIVQTVIFVAEFVCYFFSFLSRHVKHIHESSTDEYGYDTVRLLRVYERQNEPDCWGHQPSAVFYIIYCKATSIFRKWSALEPVNMYELHVRIVFLLKMLSHA